MTDTHTTAHIPDEAVQAREKIEKIAKYFINEGSRDYTQEICYALKNVGLELLDALNDIPHLTAPRAVEVPTKAERHANTARNLIINQTSTDLENIINGHDPEQSILNNDVWDRLDKMACEIEALTKPADVAAVREVPVNIDKLIAELKSAEDMCFSWSGSALLANELNAADTDEGHISLYKDLCGLGNAMSYLQSELRDISAEPAQGGQWEPIETAPRDGSTFLAVNIGEIERWHTTQEGVVITVKANDRPMTCACYNDDDGTPVFTDEFGEVYMLDGIVCDAEDMTAAENVLRLTCWMPLPAAPTTEVGK